MKQTKWIFALCMLSAGCATVSHKPRLRQSTSVECQTAFEQAPLKDVLKTLSSISSLYDQKCYHEVIALGDFVRNQSRDKYYHFFNETMEFVTPEGTFTEYVLESYERSYLSFLMASSYEQLALRDDSKVELRKAYQEGQALIYNYGDDPVNLVLQAALWENSHATWDSRPLWKKVAELAGDNLYLKKFVEQRIRDIDSGKKLSKPWKIYAVGKFPELEWNPDLTKGNGSYFTIKPQSSFMMTCVSEQSLLLPTEAWARKISHKYDRDYHPLLHLQTWTRLPVGLTVGAVTALSGVGVAVAGCGADFYFSGDVSKHPLCEASLAAGSAIAGKSGTVTGYVLRPDLRYWSEVPEAFMITQAENFSHDVCRPQWGNSYKLLTGGPDQVLREIH